MSPIAKIGKGVEVEPGVYVHWLVGQPIPYIHQILQSQIPYSIIGAALAAMGGLIWPLWSLQIATWVWIVAAIALGLGIRQKSQMVDIYDRVLTQFSEETLTDAVLNTRLPPTTNVCVLRHLTCRFPGWQHRPSAEKNTQPSR